jgi:hypothetical protein
MARNKKTFLMTIISLMVLIIGAVIAVVLSGKKIKIGEGKDLHE